ncbi:MAG: nitroreductase family protein [Nitrososphaerales archaeon]
MEFDLVIRKRRMVRAYKKVKVEEYKIKKILENAYRAPSAGNLQPQEFIIVRDERVKRELAEAALNQEFIAEAPIVIVVCSDSRRNVWRYGKRGRDFYCIIDGSFSSLLILLSCVNEGLGACFVGAFYDDEVARVLNLPKEVRPIGIIPIGYPDEKPERIPKRPLEDMIHYDRF